MGRLASGIVFVMALATNRVRGIDCGIRALLMAIATTPFAVTIAAAGQFDAVRAEIEKSINTGAVPSMAVAVAKDGQVVWQEAFGLADREGKRAATPETPYPVASVTKPFTATAVMLLRQKGLINIDRPTNEYLGSARLTARVGSADDATIRRVLSHTAGLPTHYRFFFEDETTRPPTVEDTIRCHGILMTRPGEMHLYSNLGYGILGHLIAQVSGRSYAAFLRDEVFRPLGLAHTTVGDEHRPDGAAVGYGRDGSRLPFYFTDHPAATAVFSTVGDLVRFGTFQSGLAKGGSTILTEDIRHEMQRPGEAKEYGLGWSINPDWNGYRVIWHSGAAPGASATLWIVPEHNIVIAVVGNIITAPSNQIAGKILEQLLPNRSAPASASKQTAAVRTGKGFPRGIWRGRMQSCAASEELAVEITGAGVRARISGGEWTEVERTEQADTFLGGTIRHSDKLRSFRLYLYQSASKEQWLGTALMTESLGSRGNNAIAYWTELNRVEREPR